MADKVNVYFNDTKGIPFEVHKEVKFFRDKIQDRTGFRLTLQQAYVELIKIGLENQPETIEITAK